jgi:predicted component of type VI protein secretion system
VETLQQQPAAMGPARLLVPVPGTNQMMAVNLPADRLMIGREPDCGVVLNDAEVSRRHAAVEFMHGGYWVTDLSSANGTFINGQRVQRQVLRPNDQVMLGSTILVFQVGGAPVERRCPACGRVVPPGKPFCLHDGTPVDGA